MLAPDVRRIFGPYVARSGPSRRTSTFASCSLATSRSNSRSLVSRTQLISPGNPWTVGEDSDGEGNDGKRSFRAFRVWIALGSSPTST
jgi:hypothetical protein